MRPVSSPSEEVFVYNAKSTPVLQIAYIVSWLLIARPRHSVSSAQTLGTRGWSLKTGGCDLVYTHGSGFATRRPREAYKPYHVDATHALQHFPDRAVNSAMERTDIQYQLYWIRLEVNKGV